VGKELKTLLKNSGLNHNKFKILNLIDIRISYLYTVQ